MGRAIPCLGYPSRTAAALALKAKGMGYKEIARKIGITDSAAGALLCGGKRKPRSAVNQNTVTIPENLLDTLRPAAIRRGISVAQLCTDLLTAIGNDDIADAVLDDVLEMTS